MNDPKVILGMVYGIGFTKHYRIPSYFGGFGAQENQGFSPLHPLRISFPSINPFPWFPSRAYALFPYSLVLRSVCQRKFSSCWRPVELGWSLITPVSPKQRLGQIGIQVMGRQRVQRLRKRLRPSHISRNQLRRASHLQSSLLELVVSDWV